MHSFVFDFFTQLFIYKILPFIHFIPFCKYTTIYEFILLLVVKIVSSLKLLEIVLLWTF